MRILIVGAGASIEEAKRVNAAAEFWPPTVKNFAEKMWDSPHNQFFNYWLPDYLVTAGFNSGPDPTSEFIRLANDPDNSISVERLFEYCWLNKGAKFKDDWENLIYHGILGPLNFLLIMAFCENGVGVKNLEAGRLISGQLADGDVVLNLNYDTLLEIAAIQEGWQLTYAPNKFDGTGLIVAKPHGSLNLLANETSFWFGQPDCIGALPSSGDNFRNWRAIIPPRFNKSYAQQPIAKMICDCVTGLRPDVITFWGVGLADSDVDLIDVYRSWISPCSAIEVINPDNAAVDMVKKTFEREIRYSSTIEEWLALQG